MRKSSPHSICEFGRRVRKEFLPGIEGWVASPEDVIIKKLAYYHEGRSEKHLLDIRGVLLHTHVDLAYVEHWVSALNLGTHWEKAHKG